MAPKDRIVEPFKEIEKVLYSVNKQPEESAPIPAEEEPAPNPPQEEAENSQE